MTPLCKCAHSRGEHDAGNGREPCMHRPCGCGEWRLDARSRLREEPGGKDAATDTRSAAEKIKHGTLAGYQVHRRCGIPPCDECRKASAAYQAAYYRARRQRLRNEPGTAEDAATGDAA